MSKNLVVRFAGEGGQGVVGGSELMASAAAESGYHVLTFATYHLKLKVAQRGVRLEFLQNQF